MEKLWQIISQFQVKGNVSTVEKFGSGMIHDTYRSIFVHDEKEVSYIHQHINKTVFRRPDLVMENMALVTRHIHRKLEQAWQNGHTSARRKTTLDIIPTRAGDLYYVDAEGEYWRTSTYIADTVTYDVIQNPEHAYESGKILGEFQKYVADIPPQRLHNILPNFHLTSHYYDDLLHVLKTPHPSPEIEARKQHKAVKELMDMVHERDSLVNVLFQAQQKGILQERVVHNDPKINNMLLNATDRKGLCMIDLDTVQQGLIHFDYGDCLRSAANPAGSETRELREVHFDMHIFKQISSGYLEEAHTFLTPADYEYLPVSIHVMIFELVLRFLADYLKGDVYFKKITYPDHNLNRARVQMTLLQSLESQEIV